MKPLFLSILLFSFASLVSAQLQFDLVYPQPDPGGESATYFILPNGNIVLTDYEWEPGGGGKSFGGESRGAAYLYNGATGTLISTLVGSTPGDGIGSDYRILPNGDYLLLSRQWNDGRGAVTYCSAFSGCSGTINATNSAVGRNPGDFDSGGVEVLPNSNYVLRLPHWDSDTNSDVGAVRVCSGACTGLIEPSNSLIGSSDSDRIGQNFVELTDSNFLVGSTSWDRLASRVNTGALVWCDGQTGCAGVVSESNALFGLSTNDGVGNAVALPNGGYVATAREWDGPTDLNAGIAAACETPGGCTGPIRNLNNVQGSRPNDRVGSNVEVLPNGSYVIISPSWGATAGAVTFCLSGAACAGIVPSSANSLVGARQNDFVGSFGVTPLANGNYVVQSPQWQNSTTEDRGAATFCSGTLGCVGDVSTTNSLFGESSSSQVGREILALPNGNYAVVSPGWEPANTTFNSGAVTFCDGTTGCIGPVTTANSLTGQEVNARIGEFSNRVLPNGNFLIYSPNANFGGGAYTWCSGTTGCPLERLTTSNSLVGTAGARVRNNALIMPNGDYVIPIPEYDRFVPAVTGDGELTTDVGTVMKCSGTAGCIGRPTEQNALSGSNANDRVGQSIAVSGNNFIVASPEWDNGEDVDVGAITICGTANSCEGVAVGTENSIVGANPGDLIGDGGLRIIGDDFAAISQSYSRTAAKSKLGSGSVGSGAVTFVDSDTPTSGTLDESQTTVFGTNQNFTFYVEYDPINDQMVVGRTGDNLITIFRNLQPTDAPFDFDGDGKSDIGVFRPSTGTWWFNRSSEGVTAVQFGDDGDYPIGEDFDGDGRDDISVWRPGPPDEAAIYILQSSDSTVRAELFGQTGDDPVLMGDWDGDGKADPAVYRDNDFDGRGRIYYRASQNNPSGALFSRAFGIPGDRAIKGDFDGNGRLDPAVYRPSNRRFWVLSDRLRVLIMGEPSDFFFASDISGNAASDIVAYRPSTSTFYNFNLNSGSYSIVQWGIPGDIPIPADFDGDGRSDYAVFRPSNGTWWIRSDDGSLRSAEQFGTSGDIPIPSSLVNSSMP